MKYKLLASSHKYQIETQINELAEDNWLINSFAHDDGAYFVVMEKSDETY